MNDIKLSKIGISLIIISFFHLYWFDKMPLTLDIRIPENETLMWAYLITLGILVCGCIFFIEGKSK